MGSLFGTLGYYYVRSIADFREDASKQRIELRAFSDLLWMFLAALFHHVFRKSFRMSFEEPITRWLKKNSKEANPSKTIR